MFYNKTIDLVEMTNGYLDDYGIWHEGEEKVIKTTRCDVQPYSKDLLYQDYGYQDQCIKRIFMDLDNDYKIGKKIKYNSQLYKTMRVIDWDDYQELMIDDE